MDCLTRVVGNCRHLHQLLDMSMHTPNLVNMMMETRPASLGAPTQQPQDFALPANAAQTGRDADVTHCTHQLGESW